MYNHCSLLCNVLHNKHYTMQMFKQYTTKTVHLTQLIYFTKIFKHRKLKINFHETTNNMNFHKLIDIIIDTLKTFYFE